MRLLAILAAVLATAAGLTAALLTRADGPSAAHANQATARMKTPARADATAARVGLGIISDNLPLFVRQTGIHPALTSRYVAWGTAFPAAEVRVNHRLGATTLVVLEPRTISPRRIVAGHGDAYLARWAAAERKLGLPIMLAFAPEANGPWYPWGKGHISPALYIRMYRLVHNVLLKDGARRVTWLWQVNKITSKTEPLNLLWPGRAYVDLVGIDAAMFGGKSTFSNVFGPTFAKVRSFTRTPVMLSEVSMAPGPARPREITGLFSAARKEHLTALNFFDVHIWNFDHDRATLRALRAAARTG